MVSIKAARIVWMRLRTPGICSGIMTICNSVLFVSSETAERYIGNTVINGLSGGQRKRTAIGAAPSTVMGGSGSSESVSPCSPLENPQGR